MISNGILIALDSSHKLWFKSEYVVNEINNLDNGLKYNKFNASREAIQKMARNFYAERTSNDIDIKKIKNSEIDFGEFQHNNKTGRPASFYSESLYDELKRHYLIQKRRTLDLNEFFTFLDDTKVNNYNGGELYYEENTGEYSDEQGNVVTLVNLKNVEQLLEEVRNSFFKLKTQIDIQDNATNHLITEYQAILQRSLLYFLELSDTINDISLKIKESNVDIDRSILMQLDLNLSVRLREAIRELNVRWKNIDKTDFRYREGYYYPEYFDNEHPEQKFLDKHFRQELDKNQHS